MGKHWTLSTETRAKMSAAQKKRMPLMWQNPEYRKKMSDAHRGQKPTNLAKLAEIARSPEGRKRMSERMKGKPAWNRGKGKGFLNSNGYPTIREGFRSVLEHRVVMQQIIGRKLKPQEVVHHWDENRKNNAEENLCLLRGRGAHQRLHAFARRHGVLVEALRFKQSWLKS